MRLTNTLGLAIALIIYGRHTVTRHFTDVRRPVYIRFYDPINHAFTQRPTPWPTSVLYPRTT